MRALSFSRAMSVALAAVLLFASAPLVSTPPSALASSPPADVDYNSVSFVDSSRGWVAGTKGTIIRTRNGGANWQTLSTGTTDDFVAVSFVDQHKGWALTSSARVYRTENGGDSWQRMSALTFRSVSINSPFYDPVGYDLHFTDDQHGFLVARAYPPASGHSNVLGLVYRTQDGGTSWDLVFEGPDHRQPGDTYPFSGNAILRAVDFASPTHGWVVGVDRHNFAYRPIVMRTTQGGGSGQWTSAGTGIPGTADLHGVSFATTQVGLAVGSKLSVNKTTNTVTHVGGAIYKSTNGGSTWAEKSSGTTALLRDVFMLDAQHAWAVGDSGTIRRTVDGGETWNLPSWVQRAVVSLRSAQVIGSPSDLKGWLAGASGRVRITTDGQNWWTPEPQTDGPPITGLTSPTHPSSATWYQSSQPVTFTWDQPSWDAEVEGYSVSLSQDSATVPNDTIDLSGASSTIRTYDGPKADGTWYFKVKAKDEIGLWGPVASWTLRLDATAPTGSIVINGGAAVTARAEVDVASDMDFGPSGPHATQAMRFSVDGGATWGAWQQFESEITLTLPGDDGLKTVHAEFRDKAGNVSATLSDTITLDTDEPAITSLTSSTHSPQTAWHSARDVELAWTGEAPTGITGYSYSWSGDPADEPDENVDITGTTLSIPGVADGVWYFKVRAEDNDGQWGPPVSRTVRIDGTLPSATIEIDGGASYTNSADVIVGSAVEWGPSGPDATQAMRFSVDGGATWGDWQPYDPVAALTLPGGDGPKTVHVEFRDAADNTAAFSDTITLDTAAPTGTVTVAKSGTFDSTGEVDVGWTVDFGPSDPHPTAAMRFSTDGGVTWSAWEPYAAATTLTLPTTPGSWAVTAQFRDGAGNIGTLVGTLEIQPPVLSVAGADRIATALATSLLAYPEGLAADGAKTVVIATGMNWPDALGGTALAGALDAPVLLTDTNTLPQPVLTEIERLGAEKAIILGGTSAVGAAVESALETALGGAANVDRIAGNDRYATANRIAREVIDLLGTEYDGTAFVATGGNFPDALAAAPLAAANGWPLYLANPASGISPATATAMAGVERVLILGGTGAVSAQTQTALNATFGAANVDRLSGADRYATAVAVANHAVTEAGHTWDRVGIATGAAFPDALAGGVLQGKVGSVMLLTTPTTLNTHAQAALSANKGAIDTVTFFGGDGAVSQAVRAAVQSAVQ